MLPDFPSPRVAFLPLLVALGIQESACMARRTPEKPTLGGLLREAATEFSGFDRGVPYTVKCLLSAPGATVRRYLDEHDPRITRPLRIFVMTLVLYFAAASLGGVNELNEQYWQQVLGSDGPGASALLGFLTRYQTALFALVLPLMMLATRVAWPRSGRTLAEHLILNTYLFSAQLLIFVPFVLVGLGHGQGSVSFDRFFVVLYSIVAPILSFGYAAWMMATFFSGSRLWSAILAVVIQLVMLLPYWFIVLAVFLLWTRIGGAGVA
ncbi:MAG: DUF3667 domain-containing protein [Rhodanobacter sp.]